MLGDFIKAVLSSVVRVMRWLGGSESDELVGQAGQKARGKARFGPFTDRKSRRRNIDATVGRWNRQAALSQSRSVTEEPLPYRPVTGVLSKGERAFWEPLLLAVNGRYQIFCKVRLSDVICCPKEHPEESRWFRKLGRYHVDFVVCDLKSTCPLLVIELDDRSHRTASRRRRELDAWKDKLVRSAKLPIYRVRAERAYEIRELAQTIDTMITAKPK